MKFIPILYSTSMVQGTLEDRKNLTRRLRGLQGVNQNPESVEFLRFQNYPDGTLTAVFHHKDGNMPVSVVCPYGKPGDVLWVRETWCHWYNKLGYYYKADKKYPNKAAVDKMQAGHGGLSYDVGRPIDYDELKVRWRPSIFMPKVACRLFLEITDIRVERLHDISPGDACDEGIEYWNIDYEALEGGELQADFKNYMWKDDEGYEDYHFPTYRSCISSFMSLWESINGKESLKANPWVWVVSFKRVEKPTNFI